MKAKIDPNEKLTIIELNEEGEGVAFSAAGEKYIIKETLPGEVVIPQIIKRGPKQSIATIRKLVRSSERRCRPQCPITKQCGACTLQHLDYKAQLEWKEQKVRGCLKKYRLMAEVIHPTLGMDAPWHYRNKTQLPLSVDKHGHYVAGFYGDRSHQLVPQDSCLLVSEKAAEITKIILSFLEKEQIPLYDEKNQSGLVRYLLLREGMATGEWLVTIVINGRHLPQSAELVTMLQAVPGMKSISLSINESNTNAILGKELISLWGPLYIEDKIGSLTFRINPLSFFQVNPKQTAVLYGTVLKYAALTGHEDVWDLYCGAGTISLFLARAAKLVRGVEIIPEAIENARENAAINGLQNSRFYVGKAEEVVPRVLSSESPGCDVVVVDPPRKGCEASLLATIRDMSPERIVYVSCNPETLARDVAILVDGGLYTLQEVQPVDMFPHTSHVETVVMLVRECAHDDEMVSIKVDLAGVAV